VALDLVDGNRPHFFPAVAGRRWTFPMSVAIPEPGKVAECPAHHALSLIQVSHRTRFVPDSLQVPESTVMLDAVAYAP
jgi:hypothetical protein